MSRPPVPAPAVLLLLLPLLCVKVVSPSPSEGKEIADRLGDDLSFASKQVIRGFTAIFAPLLDTAHGFAKRSGDGDDASQNFRTVLLRDGVNAFGKGVKASATILSSPARVVGTGLEEINKVGQAGLESKVPLKTVPNLSRSKTPLGIEDQAKIASTLLNTTASEFSQANLGAVLVEVALKNRIKDIGNKTATFVGSMSGPAPKIEAKRSNKPEDNGGPAEGPKTSPEVDELLEQFNEAVRRNDERVLSALKLVLAQINPPSN
ncbi:uncharacterized protein LOC124373960 [Homalodisca vitripennis]|uniref:uncharacterized protein LOC124373960 n=1 Tax=Homalodisca vitripennis TaxID=197043 RepID=UPI001EE9D7B2|nr:uncharacterized protein LOC124373960 [Homalodisca vitripennis]